MPDYSNLVKVKDGAVTREPVPAFLANWQIPVAQLADLTWLGIPDYEGWGWWPLQIEWPALGKYQSYEGDDVLTIDTANTLVVSTRAVRDWTAAEILAFKQSTTRRITEHAFRSRFTQPERIAFEMAQIDDPAAAVAARQLAAALRVMDKDLAASDYIDLNDPATQAGAQQLEALGVIAAGRADEIIWGDIAAIEIP